MTDVLARLAALVERETGIVVKESQTDALVAALRRVSPATTAETLLAEDDPEHALLLGRLVDQLAVQETFFLRESSELEAIDWHRLLAAAHARGAAEVNVWVAACASGEEAYSVAMLATEAFGHGRPPVSILATDISLRALRRAEAGVYSERSVRGLSPERRDRFLVRGEKGSVVGEQLRSLVRLRRHNLIADPAPPPAEVSFDLILCRNVLIYFGSDTAAKVVRSLQTALRPGGDLILGAADRLVSSARRLGAIAPGGETTAEAPRATVSRRPRTRQANRQARPRRPAKRVPAARSHVPLDLGLPIGAADRGDYEGAIESAKRVLEEDPLNAEAHFVRGLSELTNGDPELAIDSLRRALYVEPSFVLAAFQLARAHDLRGDEQAARRAYLQTLRALAGDTGPSHRLIEPDDVGEIAAACRARIASL
ncbi:MAG: CheR family methyltransferase [Solirubrobacterales bacterium]